MVLYDDKIICGCTDGLIRIFDTANLKHIVTLHRPVPLGKANIDSTTKKNSLSTTSSDVFADVVALHYNKKTERLCTVYSNNVVFFWSISNLKDVTSYRNFIFQAGSINNLSIIETNDMILRIASASDDRTVFIWNFKFEDFLIDVFISNDINRGKTAASENKLLQLCQTHFVLFRQFQPPQMEFGQQRAR